MNSNFGKAGANLMNQAKGGGHTGGGGGGGGQADYLDKGTTVDTSHIEQQSS